MTNKPNSNALSLQLLADRSLIRAASHSTRYFTATLVAPTAEPREQRLPVNVALVLDRSGSMSDARKFDLAREAVEAALGMLRKIDRFSLVVYDDHIDVLARSTLATESARSNALRALAEIQPRGSTDLGGGWLTGCEQVAEHLDREGVNRCLLLTDGLANHGITDHEELAMHARELRVRGVVTSTIGVGADFDERLLRDLAHEGGGTFTFIEGAAQIREALTAELGEAAEVTVQEASIHVSAPEGVRVEVLNRFRSHTDRASGGLVVALGDLVSNQEITVTFAATFPKGEIGERLGIRVSALEHDHSVAGADAELAWKFANHTENDAQARERAVDRAVASVFASRARAEATEANRRGDLSAAKRVLMGTAKRIKSYAANDDALGRLACALEESVVEYGVAEMSPHALKASFYANENALKSRTPAGRATRR
ncbi:MAG: VWA domain-containing protein, partial [Gemmatimonadaceae bacterium]